MKKRKSTLFCLTLFLHFVFIPLTIALSPTMVEINFTDSFSDVYETNIPNNSCRPFTELQIELTISGNPTLPFTTYFFTHPSGTADGGVDYELLTDSLLFSPGDDLQQKINIRIFDDAFVDKEAIETIFLVLDADQYTGIQNQHTIYIYDNDLDPLTDSVWMTLLEENFEGSFSFGDLFQDTLWAKGQAIPSNNQWYVGEPGALIGANGLYISDEINGPYQYNTSSQSSVFVRTPAVDVSLASDVELQFDYKVMGQTYSDYGRLGFMEGLSFYTLDGSSSGPYVNQPQTTTRYFDVPTSLDNPVFLAWSWKNDWSGGTQPPFALDNILLKGYEPISVATNLFATDSTYLTAGETAHLYSDKNQIICSINQISGAPIGCTNVIIDGIGEGASIIPWAEDYLFSDKTFYIESDNDTLYEITLYYTAEELMELGPDPNQFNLLKSQGPISEAEASNSQIIPASEISVSTFGPNNSFYAFKVTLNGFSGFALTNAPESILPVELLSFQGKTIEEGNLIFWESLNELNNDYYTLEKSDNGADFYQLGKIPGFIQSDQLRRYEFLDKAPHEGINYYRLSQTDLDGQTKRLGLISILNEPSEAFSFEIIPNPTDLDLCFLKGSSPEEQKVHFRLMDSRGTIVEEKFITLPEGSFRSQVLFPLHLSPGIYYISLQTGKEFKTRKVVIK